MSALATASPATIAPGIYYDMPPAEYHAAPGLSNSGMKDLMVSPLRYWHKHINPDAPPDDPTDAMLRGSALHCAVLESEETFDSRYTYAVEPADFPGCLVKMDELRAWCVDHGIKPKGTRKEEVIGVIHSIDPGVPIFDVMERRHYGENGGKEILTKADWYRLAGMAATLRKEPRVNQILAKGRAEVSVFATDPDTGILLKARLDWVNEATILDLKSFSQMRGKSIDQTIADAIYYEGYYRQACFYSMVLALAELAAGKKFTREFAMAFVESEQPHETRIKALRPREDGNSNLYWERGRAEIRQMIRLYVESKERFGNKSWRSASEITPLMDEDIRQLSYN